MSTIVSGSELSAQVIREAQFREGWRGYSQAEVDEFLERVADGVDVLHARIRELTSAAAARPVTASGSDDSVRRTLVLAQRAADLVVSEAKSVADRLVSDATERAETLVAEANARATEIVAAAESTANATKSGSQSAAAEVRGAAVANAEETRTKAASDADALRREAQRHAAELRSQAESDAAQVRAEADGHAAAARTAALADAKQQLDEAGRIRREHLAHIEALQAHAATTHSSLRRLLEDQLRQVDAFRSLSEPKDLVGAAAGVVLARHPTEAGQRDPIPDDAAISRGALASHEDPTPTVSPASAAGASEVPAFGEPVGIADDVTSAPAEHRRAPGGEAHDAPVKDAPVEDTPVEDALVKDALVKDALVKDALVKDALVKDALVKDALVEDAPVADAAVKDALVEDALVEDALVEDALVRDPEVGAKRIDGVAVGSTEVDEDEEEAEPLVERLRRAVAATDGPVLPQGLAAYIPMGDPPVGSQRA